MKVKTNKEVSFATLWKQGTAKEELMKRFGLNEAKFEKVVADVKRIESENQAKTA